MTRRFGIVWPTEVWLEVGWIGLEAVHFALAVDYPNV